MPGQAPSALTRSSAVTGLFGVNGGVSIEMLRMNTRPVRENQSASRDNRSDCSISAVPEQPEMTGASTSNASNGFRLLDPCTIDQAPASAPKSLGLNQGFSRLDCLTRFLDAIRCAPRITSGAGFARKRSNYLSEHHFAA